MTTKEAIQKLDSFIKYLETCPEEWYTDVVISIKQEEEKTIECPLEFFDIHVKPTKNGFKVYIDSN